MKKKIIIILPIIIIIALVLLYTSKSTMVINYNDYTRKIWTEETGATDTFKLSINDLNEDSLSGSIHYIRSVSFSETYLNNMKLEKVDDAYVGVVSDDIGKYELDVKIRLLKDSKIELYINYIKNENNINIKDGTMVYIIEDIRKSPHFSIVEDMTVRDKLTNYGDVNLNVIEYSTDEDENWKEKPKTSHSILLSDDNGNCLFDFFLPPWANTINILETRFFDIDGNGYKDAIIIVKVHFSDDIPTVRPLIYTQDGDGIFTLSGELYSKTGKMISKDKVMTIKEVIEFLEE